MLNNGSFAVALVRRQVMIVQGSSSPFSIPTPQLMMISPIAARTHLKGDKYLDVQTYSSFGERVFLASEIASARIAVADILSILNTPTSDMECSHGIIELPQRAFSEYLVHSERQQKRLEDAWCAWTAKH
jgi:hypothetical protein